MDCQSVPNCKTDCQSVLLKEDHVEFKYLLLETTDGVATLTINRPEALNALNGAMLAELECALNQLDSRRRGHGGRHYRRGRKGLRRGGRHQGNVRNVLVCGDMPLCGPVSG